MHSVGEPAAVLVHGGEGGDDLVHEPDLVVAQVARRRRRRGRCAAAPTAAAGGCRDRRPGARAATSCPSARGRSRRWAPWTGWRSTAGSLFQRSTMRRRFCRISWSSPRVRMRPGRWRRASVSRESHRRRKGSSHQASPKSSRPVVATAAAVQVLGLERDHGAPVVAEAMPERHHLVRPGAARRGDPGHGASPYPQRGENGRMRSRTSG